MSLRNAYKWLGVELVEVSRLEKSIALFGGGLAVFLVAVLSALALPAEGAVTVIASTGASAVLLFAVPHGPLSQPWPVIAGHVVSAVIGVACAQLIGYPPLAVACAVGLSIGAMLQLKCVHPPGGATAFTAVMGGSAIHQLGFKFVLFPVLTNALVMVLLAIVINGAFKWRRYPAVLNRSVTPSTKGDSSDVSALTHQRVLAAIRSLDSFVDISEEDLIRLTELLKEPLKGVMRETL
ncbi:HPP family protein [Armatimonas rosea]|uniref:CBS-domain-containing membrane protein n=1 Tax=Armatimonas rosea TaxID=685828 RepID=A0A7W9SX34_ARMRO|nr:HPP family protein [Armatimonas rosea]MBB6053829.1 CBS-domain-containing membrane protein [Armatimonas rosea]